MRIFCDRVNGTHQIFHHPVRPPLLNDFLSTADIDRSGLAVHSQAPPVPEFKGKDIGRRTDFQNHSAAARAVNGSGRDQEVVVLLSRDLVDELLRVKRRAALLCHLQLRDHIGDLYTLFQAQIYAGALFRVQNVIALVLRVSHAKIPMNIVCRRVHLQRQVLAADRIQKVEPYRKLRAKPGVHFGAQQRLRMTEDQVHGRHLQHCTVQVEADAVLLRHTVKAPCVVVHFRIQPAYLLHPLTAPDSGVKIRNDPERSRDLLPKHLLKEVTPDHHVVFIPVGIDEVLHLVHEGHLPLVRDAPLQKIPLLEFLQYIFVRLVREIARHAGTVAQLDLPAAHVGVDAQSFVRQKRCAKSINGDFSAAGGVRLSGCVPTSRDQTCLVLICHALAYRDLTPYGIHLLKINEVRQFPAVHAAEDAVLCKDIVQQNIEFFAVLQDLPR